MMLFWRRQLIIWSCLGLLALPIYFIDHAIFAPSGGSNWITLDFRGLLFWSYLIWAAIYIALSSITLLFLRTGRRFRFHLGLMALSLILFVTGAAVYVKIHDLVERHQYAAVNSPHEEDDGQFFYGVLPPPSQPRK